MLALTPHPPTTNRAAPLPALPLLARLLAALYDEAAVPQRRHLIRHLLTPLGVLPLVVIAGGVFAPLRLRAPWPQLDVREADAMAIEPAAVAALAAHVLQVRAETLDELLPWLSPVQPLGACAAAAPLRCALMAPPDEPVAATAPAAAAALGRGDAAGRTGRAGRVFDLSR